MTYTFCDQFDNITAVGGMVDINCDMGESFGVYTTGADEQVVPYITSSNIACGFHASDPVVMEKTVKLCREHDVMVGAHPGYPDILGFGRRHMDVEQPELVDYVVYQVGALSGFLRMFDLPLQHVKLHGALYNYMVNQEERFIGLAEAVARAFGDVIFLTLGTKRTQELKRKAREKGIRVALEAFPDRNYTDEGELLGRKHKEAVFHDPELIARRAVIMARRGGIESINGQWIDMDVDTLCIHGDNAESIEAAQKIFELLGNEGIRIRPMRDIVT